MKILLISGHGAGDPGAVAKIDGRVYREADLTREVVANLKPLLEQYGAKVDVYPTARNALAIPTATGWTVSRSSKTMITSSRSTSTRPRRTLAATATQLASNVFGRAEPHTQASSSR